MYLNERRNRFKKNNKIFYFLLKFGDYIFIKNNIKTAVINYN
jgi:hypothetical protein